MREAFEAVLEQYGEISPYDDEVLILCPFHKEKLGREDTNPSCSVNKVTGLFNCLSCHSGGNFLELYAKLNGLSIMQAAFRLPKAARIAATQRKPKVENVIEEQEAARRSWIYYSSLARLDWHTVESHYMLDRGYTPETLNHFGVRLDPLMRYSIIIPRWDSDGIWRGVVRRIVGDGKPKYKNSEGMKKEKYLLATLKPGMIGICEGPSDQMAAFQYGVRNMLPTHGTEISDRQVQMLASLAGSIVGCYNNDEAGAMGHEKLVKKFEPYKIPVRRFHFPSDVNDIAEMEKRQFLQSYAFPKISSKFFVYSGQLKRID